MTSDGEGELNELLKPISWLVGKWNTTTGSGILPDEARNFKYYETLEFAITGTTPFLHYTATSKHPVKLCHMHCETGYMRGVQSEGKKFALMVSHGFGVVTLEEGSLSGEHELLLKAVHINRMSEAKDPAIIQLERRFKLDPVVGTLLQEVYMATSQNPELSLHLSATYTSGNNI